MISTWRGPNADKCPTTNGGQTQGLGRTFLLSHSSGAMVAAEFANRYEVDGLFLLSPALDVPAWRETLAMQKSTLSSSWGDGIGFAERIVERDPNSGEPIEMDLHDSAGMQPGVTEAERQHTELLWRYVQAVELGLAKISSQKSGPVAGGIGEELGRDLLLTVGLVIVVILCKLYKVSVVFWRWKAGGGIT